MTDAARARRLAVRIRQIVADTLEREVKDPRLTGMVTVTEARVSADLREATVFYTVLGGDGRETAAALESAKGLVRTAVGRRTGVRFAPALAFVPDAVPGDAAHIEDLLVAAHDADARVAAARREAQPAGETDPYREGATDR